MYVYTNKQFRFAKSKNYIKTRDSELRGQEASCTRQMSRLKIVSREVKKKQAVHRE